MSKGGKTDVVAFDLNSRIMNLNLKQNMEIDKEWKMIKMHIYIEIILSFFQFVQIKRNNNHFKTAQSIKAN